MNRTFFHPLLAIAIAGGVACSSAATTTPPAPQWTPTAKKIPTRDQCRAAAAANRLSCYQILLAEVLKSEGIDSAMTMLTRLDASERDVRENDHMFAHSLGLAAYTNPAELASVFARCSPGFQSGCYHGVIQGYFLEQHKKSPASAVDAPQVNSVCKDFRGGAQSWLLFQCAHGVGHGLELIYSHDLPRSLKGCDLVTDIWERNACYGGAFMENIVAVTSPHQTAEGIAGGMDMEMDGDMAGMDMSEMDHSDSSSSFKKFDPANPLYPCSALDERYGAECYLIQTSLMLFENKGDFGAAANTCQTVPKKFLLDCFVSLGRDANSYAEGNASRAAASCNKAPETFRPWCHTGVAKNLVDITTLPSDGFAYCSTLTESVSKVTCYSAVGEELRALTTDAARRTELCSTAPSPFDAACRYGAGVSNERPADLAGSP